jgi:transcriptional regulator with XRE-family HTH domain
MSKVLEIFSRNLKKYRESEGLTQDELAKKIGATPQTIWALENGKSWVSSKTLESLSRELRVEDSAFFWFPSSKPEPIEECYRRIGEAIKKVESVSDLDKPSQNREEKANRLKQALRILREEIASLSPAEQDKFLEGLRTYSPGSKG